MKNNPRSLPILRTAAALAVLAALMMTVRSLATLRDSTDLYRRRTADAIELAALRQRAHSLNAIVATREQEGSPSGTLSDLLQTALPGHPATTREMDPTPTLAGWTARRVSVVLSDVSGDELGRFLQTAADHHPPWALLECSLLAAPTPGRLTKAELVLGSVEHAAGRQP